MLGTRFEHPEDSPRAGAWLRAGYTVGTASRLEGLLAVLDYLPPERAETRASIRQAAREGIAFLLNSQVRSGPLAGGMPRAHGRLPWLHPDNRGTFNERATEIRIDYVQHAMCAMMQFERMGSGKDADVRGEGTDE
jgi:hypothetical protein